MRAVVILVACVISHVLVAQDAIEALPELSIPSDKVLTYDPFSGLPSSELFDINISYAEASQDQDEVLEDSTDMMESVAETATDEDLDLEPIPVQNSEIQPREYILKMLPVDNLPLQLTGSGPNLPIEVTRADRAILSPAGLGIETHLLVSTLPAEVTQVGFSLNIPESIYADAGDYSLILEVSLLDPISRAVLAGPKLMRITANVPKKLQTNIAGTRGPYDEGVDFSVIDFEELESGESRRVFIQVRGNTRAAITVSSENDGKMVNLENSKFYVDYSVDVDGTYSSLETPLKLNRTAARDLQGSAYPMTVTIGDVSRSFSGEYQDVITVDVTPE